MNSVTKLKARLMAIVFVVSTLFVQPFSVFMFAPVRADDCSAKRSTLDSNLTVIYGLYQQLNSLTEEAKTNSTGIPNGYNKDSFVRTYSSKMDTYKGQMQTYGDVLRSFADERCPDENYFKTKYRGLKTLVDRYNEFGAFANVNQFIKISYTYEQYGIPFSEDYYQSGSTDQTVRECSRILSEIQAKLDAARVKAQRVADWISNNSVRPSDVVQEHARTLDSGNEDFRTAQNLMRQAQTKGCNTNSTTQALYNQLLSESRRVAETANNANSALGRVVNSWDVVLDQTAQNIVGQFSECRCNENGLFADLGVGAVIKRAFCFALCALSVALGNFACIIASKIIDPIMNRGQATCQEGSAAAPPSGSGGTTPSVTPGGGGSGATSPPATPAPSANPKTSDKTSDKNPDKNPANPPRATSR